MVENSAANFGGGKNKYYFHSYLFLLKIVWNLLHASYRPHEVLYYFSDHTST